eukprot:jgi/Bigna1/85146/estExt_fgenesh1_pg.C_20304
MAGTPKSRSMRNFEMGWHHGPMSLSAKAALFLTLGILPMNINANLASLPKTRSTTFTRDLKGNIGNSMIMAMPVTAAAKDVLVPLSGSRSMAIFAKLRESSPVNHRKISKNYKHNGFAERPNNPQKRRVSGQGNGVRRRQAMGSTFSALASTAANTASASTDTLSNEPTMQWKDKFAVDMAPKASKIYESLAVNWAAPFLAAAGGLAARKFGSDTANLLKQDSSENDIRPVVRDFQRTRLALMASIQDLEDGFSGNKNDRIVKFALDFVEASRKKREMAAREMMEVGEGEVSSPSSTTASVPIQEEEEPNEIPFGRWKVAFSTGDDAHAFQALGNTEALWEFSDKGTKLSFTGRLSGRASGPPPKRGDADGPATLAFQLNDLKAGVLPKLGIQLSGKFVPLYISQDICIVKQKGLSFPELPAGLTQRLLGRNPETTTKRSAGTVSAATTTTTTTAAPIKLDSGDNIVILMRAEKPALAAATPSSTTATSSSTRMSSSTEMLQRTVRTNSWEALRSKLVNDADRKREAAFSKFEALRSGNGGLEPAKEDLLLRATANSKRALAATAAAAMSPRKSPSPSSPPRPTGQKMNGGGGSAGFVGAPYLASDGSASLSSAPVGGAAATSSALPPQRSPFEDAAKWIMGGRTGNSLQQQDQPADFQKVVGKAVEDLGQWAATGTMRTSRMLSTEAEKLLTLGVQNLFTNIQKTSSSVMMGGSSKAGSSQPRRTRRDSSVRVGARKSSSVGKGGMAGSSYLSSMMKDMEGQSQRVKKERAEIQQTLERVRAERARLRKKIEAAESLV